ncbi:hypothetical protein [Sphingomonas sp.]|uniref:hypothetical protein n=1 Tax=Sphingomonas sp. TaxID=28214 RepID=UPI002D80B3A3|nr:hypothetical protein [Sphingomonas sp.]HEU0043061.1 hypothetical protein [Sphingomonas sp.]
MNLTPGATARAFWIAFCLDVALILLIDRLDRARPFATDSYAMGAGALLPYAIALLMVLAALLFAFVRWRPLRLTLLVAAGAAAAFLLLAVTWFL